MSVRLYRRDKSSFVYLGFEDFFYLLLRYPFRTSLIRFASTITIKTNGIDMYMDSSTIKL